MVSALLRSVGVIAVIACMDRRLHIRPAARPWVCRRARRSRLTAGFDPDRAVVLQRRRGDRSAVVHRRGVCDRRRWPQGVALVGVHGAGMAMARVSLCHWRDRELLGSAARLSALKRCDSMTAVGRSATFDKRGRCKMKQRGSPFNGRGDPRARHRRNWPIVRFTKRSRFTSRRLLNPGAQMPRLRPRERLDAHRGKREADAGMLDARPCPA